MLRPKFRTRTIGGLAVVVASFPVVRAQSPSPQTRPTPAPFSASLSGAVRDESNIPVEATVTVFTQGLRRQALTASNGTFLFPNLKTGKYAICAVPTATAATAQNPFVDSCLWQDRTSLQVPLAPGQNRQGVIVPVRHGYPLHIRVNDPAALLPAPFGKLGGNHLAVHVIGPSGIAQPALISTGDPKGRDHVIVIAYDTPHKVLIHSSTFILKDATGRDLDPTVTFNVTASRTGPPPSVITVNVDRPGPNRNAGVRFVPPVILTHGTSKRRRPPGKRKGAGSNSSK